MSSNDIIDNRREKLIDHIQTILPQTEVARFAVGYLFLSGLEALGSQLDKVKELRLLIGNTTNSETIEILAEGRRRLELVEARLEETRYAKKVEHRRRVNETAENLKESVEVMDQTDEGEALIQSLLCMMEQKRLKVHIYTKGRLHAKAYIFDYTTPNPGNAGIAIVGSSNLTLSGIRDNTELNVLVHDNANPMNPKSGNHAALVEWFEDLWKESTDFDIHLMNELKQSWAIQPATPYDIYMKTLFTLVKDRLVGGLEGSDDKEILWDDEITRDLADFQKVAVRQAIQMIRDNGGCFVSDVVGLGKSYIGAGIVKHFERTEHVRPLIICPKPLEEMWIRYNEIYQLNAQVLPMSQLQQGGRGVDLNNDIRYKDRDFVLIDESHHFRHASNQRYEVLQGFLNGMRKVCLLTATPRNSRAMDVYNQIKLFHPEDKTDLPINPPDLKQYFKGIEKREKKLQDILAHILIRRTRRHILRWYGYAGDTGRPLREIAGSDASHYLNGDRRAYVIVGGRHQYFPKRELETLRYSIEETYNGLYQTLRLYLGKPKGVRAKPRLGEELTYARYGLWNFVKKEKKRVAPYTDLHRAGVNLRGLIRTMLFKRFESSVEAFRKTLERMVKTHGMFLKSLDQGFVPAGEQAEALLGRGGTVEDDDLLDALGKVSHRYDLADFDSDRLKEHILADRDLLKEMLRLVEPITPEKDDKLQTFLKRLNKKPIKGKKCLIFTQYADTAVYIHKSLNPGGIEKDIDVIYGTDKSKSKIVGRFSPKANPEFTFQKGNVEIRLLVATDVLAEGLNMQDCDIVLNYDLHWNPVRLIQRFGRIDRIGSEHQVIWGLSFLPETGIERNLGLTTVLQNRIQEIHDTIGEDARILDKSERLNEEAMYSIYQGKEGPLSLLDEGEKEEFIDLNEAEELLRTLAKEDPAEYKRITELRDGIRSGKASKEGGLYVFCQAGRYQQLFLIGDNGRILSRDIPRVLHAIKATRAMEPAALSKKHNHDVMRIKHLFEEEVRHRKSQKYHTFSLTQGQRYIMRELRILFSQTEDEEMKAQINILEKAFRMSPTVPIKKELNYMRRNGITGQSLLKSLTQLFHEHRIRDRTEQASREMETDEIPKIICSEAFT